MSSIPHWNSDRTWVCKTHYVGPMAFTDVNVTQDESVVIILKWSLTRSGGNYIPTYLYPDGRVIDNGRLTSL